MGDSVRAMEIHQDLLDRSGEAMRTRNYAAFRDCFALPTVVETFRSRCALTTEDELSAFFEEVTRIRRGQHIQLLDRRSLSAEFRDASTIAAMHQTRHVYLGNILGDKAHVGFSILHLQDGLWRVAFSQYTVDPTNALDLAIGAIERGR